MSETRRNRRFRLWRPELPSDPGPLPEPDRDSTSLLSQLTELDRMLGWRPGHFYSPYPDYDEVVRRRDKAGSAAPTFDGIELDVEGQLARLRALASALRDVPYGPEAGGATRYQIGNPNFSATDAALLHAQLSAVRPRHVIEVGCGYSSCVILDAVSWSDTQVMMVEPYPELVRSLLNAEDLGRVELLEQTVQDVELDRFANLRDGDVLFIDSSHVAKASSDVNHIIFHILPALATGVRVHFHDIYHPFDYPLSWVKEGRAWNEAYMLRAFLQFNKAFRVELFPSWLAEFHEDALSAVLPAWAHGISSSLWIVRN